MDRVFITKGHGYETGSRGRRTAFDGYEVIAEPLPTRESRILGRKDGQPGTGTDYSSHSIKLAVRPDETAYKGGRRLYILMEHGGGREVLAVKQMYDRGETERALLALPEAALYGALYTVYEMASTAARAAAAETRQQWAEAFIDGRLRKRRKGGRVSVSVETPFERDLRLGKVNPPAVAIDLANGEIRPA